ncbi:unnamed protein product [Parnassius apollo]|uniref:(apollo) hypothetical protein n=1 Tax=Parnassius apollo TaxID=110799 RepID=A0A8S3WHW1_PARAO|nr:unnamed protein product [Parnassius apollo]
MFIVGLTGGLATGKSTVLSIFRDNDVAVIDADEVARKVLEPGTKAWKELRQYFGEELLHPDVVCEDHQQLERLCKRNDLSEVVAKKRISCQMPLEQKVARSHFVIDNSGDIASTVHQTECVIRLLRRSKFTWYFRVIILIACLSMAFGAAHIISNFVSNKT